MTEKLIEQGKVYAHNYGYSICAYEFYKCVRTTKASAWLQPLGKRWVSGDGQQGMVVCTMEPIDGEIKMVRRNKYIGSEYKEGEQLYEDHCD